MSLFRWMKPTEEVFRDRGFETRQVWEAENRWLDLDGTIWPTAFVAGKKGGGGVGVHLIEVGGGGGVAPCHGSLRFVAGGLGGRGGAPRRAGCVWCGEPP